MALKGIGLNGKAEIHMRKLKMWLLGLAAAAMLSVSACAQEIPEESLNGNGSVSAEENQAESADGDSQAVSSSENGGNRVSSASGTSFNLADVPAYSGQPYVAVNGNVPGHFGKKSVQKVGTPGRNRIPRCQICIADAFFRILPVGENVVGDTVAVPAVLFVCFFNGLFRPLEEQGNDTLILQGITSSVFSFHLYRRKKGGGYCVGDKKF